MLLAFLHEVVRLMNTQLCDKGCTHNSCSGQAGAGAGLWSSDYSVCHQQPTARMGHVTLARPSQRRPAVVLREEDKRNSNEMAVHGGGKDNQLFCIMVKPNIKYSPVSQDSPLCIFNSLISAESICFLYFSSHTISPLGLV